MSTFSRPQWGWYIPNSVLGGSQWGLRAGPLPTPSPFPACAAGWGGHSPPALPSRGSHLYRGSLVSGLLWKVESPKTTDFCTLQPTGKVSPTTAHCRGSEVSHRPRGVPVPRPPPNSPGAPRTAPAPSPGRAAAPPGGTSLGASGTVTPAGCGPRGGSAWRGGTGAPPLSGCARRMPSAVWYAWNELGKSTSGSDSSTSWSSRSSASMAPMVRREQLPYCALCGHGGHWGPRPPTPPPRSPTGSPGAAWGAGAPKQAGRGHWGGSFIVGGWGVCGVPPCCGWTLGGPGWPGGFAPSCGRSRRSGGCASAGRCCRRGPAASPPAAQRQARGLRAAGTPQHPSQPGAAEPPGPSRRQDQTPHTATRCRDPPTPPGAGGPSLTPSRLRGPLAASGSQPLPAAARPPRRAHRVVPVLGLGLGLAGLGPITGVGVLRGEGPGGVSGARSCSGPSSRGAGRKPPGTAGVLGDTDTRTRPKETPDVRHCTASHCTTQHCTARHCTARHCSALHATAQPRRASYSITQSCTALPGTAHHCTALHTIPPTAAPLLVWGVCPAGVQGGPGALPTLRRGAGPGCPWFWAARPSSRCPGPPRPRSEARGCCRHPHPPRPPGMGEGSPPGSLELWDPPPHHGMSLPVGLGPPWG